MPATKDASVLAFLLLADEEQKARKREYARLYRQENRDAINARQREWHQRKVANDPDYQRVTVTRAQERRQRKLKDIPGYIDVERAKQREYQGQYRQRIRASGHIEEYQTRDREAHRQNRIGQRNTRLKRDYGITLAEFDDMLLSQGGTCAICHQPETQVVNGILSHLCVDHSHETGHIRGLLCHRCNKTIGWLETLEETALANLHHYLDQGGSYQVTTVETPEPRNREDMPTRSRSCQGAHLQNRYGLTIIDYSEMLVAQGGVCAVCHCPETQIQNGQIRNLSVDHDHQTSRVRGLLCARCNLTAGHIEPLGDVVAIAMLRYLGRKVALPE